MVAEEVRHDEESLPPHHPLKLIQHIASLMADKAAAEAALETQQASHEEQSELFETVAELMAANAALQTKLEAQSEQARLAEKLADLAAENARLKAHVELAAERTELTRGAISLSIENERLKLRLAELEQRHAAEEAVRTAERSRGNRKSQ
jgi:predicted nuclease with TOPRIM domain